MKPVMKLTAVILAVALGLSACNMGDIEPPQGLPAAGIWFETAYAEWIAGPGQVAWSAQIMRNDQSDWVDVDQPLVRLIDPVFDLWRVDVPGLRNTGAAVYELRILYNGTPVPGHEFSDLRPVPFDRQGYAFVENTSNPRSIAVTTASGGIPLPSGNARRHPASGGYLPDGTVGLLYPIPGGARIIYLTQETMNEALIELARVMVLLDTRVIVRVIGQVGELNWGYFGRPNASGLLGENMTDLSGLPNPQFAVAQAAWNEFLRVVELEGAMDVTLEGIGPDAYIEGWGLSFRQANNLVIRNLTFDWWFDDAIEITTQPGFRTPVSNGNIWIHNNYFGYGVNRWDNEYLMGSDDHDKGDGATDITWASTHWTVSYNIYGASGKAMLVGGDHQNPIGFGTIHHNWFRGTEQRTPRLRNGWLHVFNNLYDGVSGFGIGAGDRSNIIAEGNTFINTARPFIVSGSVSSSNSLGNDAPGIILTSLYSPRAGQGHPTMAELTGGPRPLVPNFFNLRSQSGLDPFIEEVILRDGPQITNYRRSSGRIMTYRFVPFHEATNYRSVPPGFPSFEDDPERTMFQFTSHMINTQSLGINFAPRPPIGDTIGSTIGSDIGVQDARDAARRVRQVAGPMPVPAWRR